VNYSHVSAGFIVDTHKMGRIIMTFGMKSSTVGVAEALNTRSYGTNDADAETIGNPVAKSRPIPLSPCNCCAAHKKAICASLDGQELIQYRKLSHVRLVRAGQAIYREMDPANYLYTIISGEARLSCLLNDGRRQVTDFRTCGDKLGENNGGFYTADAEAVTDTIVCQTPLSELQTSLDDMPGLRISLMRKMEAEINHMQNHLLLLGRKTPVEKVATFLAERARKLDAIENNEAEIKLTMSRRDIADYLGLTIETISRTLTTLKNNGVLAIPSSDLVTVIDFEELEMLAGFDR
jgi:CRP/FNR family transcriptional regulator, anaerobic regulatory protein